MKHPLYRQILLQMILLGLVELAILVALIVTLGWTARQNWSALARMAVFLAGFAVFALPIVIATQLPYRRPAWLSEAATGERSEAVLLENAYLGEEWMHSPGERIVSLPVRLDTGEQATLTCTLEEARRLAPQARLVVCRDPACAERCALAPQSGPVEV